MRYNQGLRILMALSMVWLMAAGVGVAIAATVTVQAHQIQVKGKTMTALTDGQGMTLYYSTQDGPRQAKCTGNCASYWPPLILKSGAPNGPAAVSGNLGVFQGANGRQVTYKGHPLYTFARDKKPGDATGEGVANHWHVATPDLQAASAAGGNKPSGSW